MTGTRPQRADQESFNAQVFSIEKWTTRNRRCYPASPCDGCSVSYLIGSIHEHESQATDGSLWHRQIMVS